MNLPLPEPFINFAWEPNGDKFTVLTGNQNKATPNVYKIDAKSVTPLKLISKLDAGVQFNELQWAPSGQWLAVLAKLSSGGNVMFVDTTLQEAKRTNVIEHPGFNKSYWDPTGRYFVTCTTVGGRIGTDLGYRIFTFQGRELHRKNLDRLSQFQWRPRPPVKLTEQKLKEIKKNLKKTATRFEREDNEEKYRASQEVVEKRRKIMSAFNVIRQRNLNEIASRKKEKIDLRGGVHTDKKGSGGSRRGTNYGCTQYGKDARSGFGRRQVGLVRENRQIMSSTAVRFGGSCARTTALINSLRLAEISLPVARFIYEKNRQEAYDFLGKIAKTVQKDKMAVARIHSGEIELRLLYKDNQDRVYDIAVVRNMLESTQKEIDEMIGVTEVHAPFYKVSAQYLKEIGDYAGYYREALRYLGVEDINRLTPDEKYSQALLVGFAALLGENVYNFGELLCHPILNVLKGTGERWLVEVLDAFNSGDLNKFYALEKDWSVWNDLKKDREYLVAKLRLMSIMEIALARPSKERNIPFKEIAAKCQIQVNDVEFLVMKALSKGLIQGCIDQVNQTVLITWVQPRVLNPQQILSMADRINAWRADVASMENVVNDHAKEILTKTTEKSLLT